jgi:hypothetical protein
MRLLLIFCAIALAFAACGEEPGRNVPVATPPDGHSPEEQFLIDYRAFTTGSWRITYDVRAANDDGATDFRELHELTWLKQAQDRQAFLLGDWLEDMPDLSVRIEGDREPMLLCSKGLPLDPSDEDLSGALGACLEGSTGASDIAGNIVYSLGFPLSFTGVDPNDLNADGLVIKRYTERTIAGVSARCYVGEPDDSYEGPDPEFCFGESGVLLYRHRNEFGGGLLTVEATNIGEVDDEDFELPYPHVVEPDE